MRLRVVLSDFGLAKIFVPGEMCNKGVVTPYYMAPEIIKKEPCDNSVDIWALGISLFMMLTAHYPTPCGMFKKKGLEAIKAGKLNYALLDEMEIDNDAIDLIKKLCAYKPSKRITAQEALNHIWIRTGCHEKAPLESAI